MEEWRIKITFVLLRNLAHKNVIGENIKELCHQIGWSQERLALELNVRRQTVNNWERNVSSPDITMLRKLKVIFRCSHDDLIDERN